MKEFPTEDEYIKLVQDAGKEVPEKPKSKPKSKPPKQQPKKEPESSSEKPPSSSGSKPKVVKRAMWGKMNYEKHDEELKANGNSNNNKKNGSSTPTYENNSEDENDEDQENLMRTKKGELEDWKLLKQTLRVGGEDLIGIDLQEKADMLLEKKEELISKHMKYIRQVALMLKQEGELITQVQGPESDEEKYITNMRKIVRQKLKIYQDLDNDLEEVERLMKEEEEAYNKANR